MKNVAQLLDSLPGATLLAGSPDTAIGGIEHDSRNVSHGDLFVAITGFHVDGHDYLPQALDAGAAALLVRNDRRDRWQNLAGAPAIVAVDDTRPALSAAAAWFHDSPGQEMTVIGITGTDGKTTTSYLLTAILEAAGATVGRLGTVDVRIAGETDANLMRMTTPEANEVQRLLRSMADAGCEFAIVESTSHGLALNRLDHVDYDIAVVTNVAGDHLDFHETFEAYREAKGRLFSALESASSGDTTAIVNLDDPSAHFMLERAPSAEHVSYGLDNREADIRASNVLLRPDGSDFRIEAGSQHAETSIRLPAVFNVANALAATGAALGCGVPLPVIAAGLAACEGVPGRMERVAAGQPFEVIVDFAHTGEAVRKVLEVLRAVSTGKLIIVVGAAGERDPGRRFGVARAAAEGADFAVFTNEDPRSEDPAAIVAEIGQHAEGAGRERGQDFVEIEDRREAIATALGRATPGDLVVVCGKGHEQSIIYGVESRPWDDRIVAREELARLGWTERTQV